jgi:imidazolonepropionase-like amidohydrolase
MMGARRRARFAIALRIGSAALAATTGYVSVSGAEALVVRAERLHTGTGVVIENGAVVVEDGRITAVGDLSGLQVPEGASELDATEVTPGFIDTHTSAGLAGLRNVDAVRDQDEKTAPDQASLRAIDAFDPRDPLLRYLLEHGTTVVQAGPGPASPIAGQAGIFRTHGTSADAMVVRFPSAMVFNLGDVPKSTFSEEGPSTRMGTAALIRRRLVAGRHYAGEAGKLFGGPDAPDLGLEALGAVAAGELTAIFHARRADDISTALRLTREFGLRTAVAGASEGYLIRDQLRDARVPVLVGPIMERVSAPETENASYENAALLADAGVPIALRTGFEAYVPKNRVLLFEAAIAAANGLGADRALRAITLDAAELLDIAEDYGSLEVGKVADLVLFDGDPFEYTTHIEAVVSAGEVIRARAAPWTQP